MSSVQLMAVGEIDNEDRIICQRDGCGHRVYKRIHIVRANGRVGWRQLSWPVGVNYLGR